MTRDRLIEEIKEATRIPGVSPIMTQPIQNRIDMLATGIQTPIGVKIFGKDLSKIVEIGLEVEKVLGTLPGAVGPYAERADKRPYFEIEIDRQAAARYGVQVGDIQHVIMTAIGGMNISTAIEGRERIPIRVRYMRELRDNPEAMERIFIPTPSGAQIPLKQLAKLRRTTGPAVIGSENGMKYGRVFVSVDQKVIGLVDFVKQAQEKVREQIIDQGKLPAGYFITWSGQYESEIEARNRLQIALPVALAIILLLLYMAFNSLPSLLVVATGIPVSLMGGLILLHVLGFHMSVAVWVGFIALFGVATDNAVVLISAMDDLFSAQKKSSVDKIRKTVLQAGLMRVRPIMMTTSTTILALIPVMLLTGAGSEIMKPMSSPIIGGLVTATLSNLFLVPVLYSWIKERRLMKEK
jgi:Cu(I)/Ag(I) efflux system membrane protein CusA/SilA